MIRYLGHSAFEIDFNGKVNLLIDPFITGNPLTTFKATDFEPDYIVLSHAHSDHIGDTEEIAKRSGATIVSSFEIVNYFAAKGLNGHPMNPGGGYDFSFGRISFTPAWHSSSFDDGSYGGMPMGIVLDIDGKRIYHAGDTALFSDMALIGRKAIDVALLPIGDNFTMGPADAVEAVKLLKPKTVVPIHYNTFDMIKQDPHIFKKSVEAQTDSICLLMDSGDKINP